MHVPEFKLDFPISEDVAYSAYQKFDFLIWDIIFWYQNIIFRYRKVFAIYEIGQSILLVNDLWISKIRYGDISSCF